MYIYIYIYVNIYNNIDIVQAQPHDPANPIPLAAPRRHRATALSPFVTTSPRPHASLTPAATSSPPPPRSPPPRRRLPPTPTYAALLCSSK